MSVPGPPLRSEFSSDAEMREIIEMFVQELPQRIAELERAWRDSNLDEVKRFAHQMKGAAPGYGFDTVGQAAAALERAAATASDLDRAKADLDALINLCSRVTM
jgi:HPt (histidine-containing phosphotransfer) domain-containing protein